jgi:ElaB/YqjD/DUF883 family membrane-anchored ribosome-binding protein
MASNRQLAQPQSAGNTFDEARRALDEIRQAIDPVRHFLEQAISDHPVPAVGISLAMGVLLGWFIKR